MELYLIRHGATAGNLEKRYVGATDESLVREAVSQLKKDRRRYPVPQSVLASPMKRCQETAALLFPGMEIRTVKGLRECNFGAFEYRNYQELNGDETYQRWIDSGGTLPFPGGESQKRFQERSCTAFLDSLVQLSKEGCASAAYVVHGGTIMSVMERFCTVSKTYFDWQTGNGTGYVLQLSDEDVERLEQMRDVPARFLLHVEELPLPSERVHASGIEEVCVIQKNRRLQCGYTTGSCAAAAARAAAEMLFTHRPCREVRLLTPKGIALSLETEFPKCSARHASCAVRKFAGDDPDATDGLLVFAEAELAEDYGSFAKEKQGQISGELTKQKYELESSELAGEKHGQVLCELTEKKQKQASGELGAAKQEQDSCGLTKADGPGDREESEVQVLIDGGVGVGHVTRPGLEQPVGAAAINRIPREMITQNVREVCAAHGYAGAVRVTISVQGGAEAAKHTFNPNLGIEGGISILGTSGIVVPMSEQALIESIRIEMRQKVENGERYLLMTPGNYGADFVRGQEQYQMLRPEYAMKCSNYVGETLDMAVELGVRGILFVAHIGKFIKVSGGVMNTHSAHADCRAELMAAQALRAGADRETGLRLLNSNTTEEALEVLRETPYLKETVRETLRRIQFHLQKRCEGELKTGVVLFSNRYGYLGESEHAAELIRQIAQEKQQLSR